MNENSNGGEDGPNQELNILPNSTPAIPGNMQDGSQDAEPEVPQGHAKEGDPVDEAEEKKDLKSSASTGSAFLKEVVDIPVDDLTDDQRLKKAISIMNRVFGKGNKAQIYDKAKYDSLEEVQEALKIQTGAKFEFTDQYGVLQTQHVSWTSLYCFSHTNCLRKMLLRLVNWHWFDNFIIFSILVNSVMLGLVDYDNRLLGEVYKSPRNALLDKIGFGLSAIFLLECIFKIIAMGFIIHNRAYLKDPWNWLDFFVVCISLIDVIPIGIEAGFLKIMRTVRILRPLRSINKIPELKKLIGTLLKSLPGLTQVGVFLFFTLSIFAIFGINQFSGAQYQRCREQFIPDLNPDFTPAVGLEFSSDSLECSKWKPWPIDYDVEWLCNSDEMCETYLQHSDSPKTYKCGAPKDFNLPVVTDNLKTDELVFYDIINFDNYGRALLSIFVAITLEGWVLMMYNYMDANSNMFSVLFFVLVVFFGAFLALNLVLAQIMESFYAQENDRLVKQEFEAKEQQKLDDLLHAKEAVDEANAKLEADPVQSDEAHPIALVDGHGQIKNDQNQSDQTKKNTPEILKSKATTGQVVELVAIQKRSDSVNQGILTQIKLDEEGQPDADVKDATLVQKDSAEQPNNDDVELPAVKPEPEDSEKALVNCPESEGESELEDEAIYDKDARLRAQNNSCIRFFYNIVTSTHFNFFIFCMIIGNTITLAIDDYPNQLASNNAKFAGGGTNATSIKSVLGNLNDYFTFLFLAEMLIKLIALHPKNYFRDNFNLFDSIVVAISVIDFIIDQTFDHKSIGSGADFLQALRSMRLLRVIKLMRTWSDLQDILGKIGDSLKDISYFTILLVLYMYIMALLGMELFANLARYDKEDNLVTDLVTATSEKQFMLAPRENFDDVGKALTTVFILILGEDWPGVMYTYIRVYGGNVWVSIYFLFCFALGNLMMLSLFTAILLQNFEGGDDDEDEEDGEKKSEVEGSLHEEDIEEMFRNETTRLPQKPSGRCSGTRLFCLKFKLEYVSAFGTHADTKDAQKKVDAFNKTQVTSDRQVLPDGSDKSVNEQNNSQGHETLIKAELQSELKNERPHASSPERNVDQILADKDFEQQQEDAVRMGQANSSLGFEGTGVVRLPAQSPQLSPSPRGMSSHKKNKTTSSLTHIATIFEKKKTINFMDARSVLFENMTGNAFCCLSKNNCLRIWCGQLSTHKYFDWVILIFITISTVLLAVQSPVDDPNSTLANTLTYIDYGMTAIFTFEMVVKMISAGLILNGKNSYLFNPWNILDFLIVSSAIVGLIPGTGNISFLKALRMLRILRPLRLISRNKNLKLAIVCLIKSIPSIANLLLIVLFFIFLLGILGTTLWSGKFYKCHMKEMFAEQANKPLIDQNPYYETSSIPEMTQFIVDKWDCLNYGGEWINSDLNFDTTATSLITLITIQTTEGWIGVMWSAVDSVKQGFQPIQNNSPQYIILFIMLIILICLLFLNLFVGVVCDTFNTEKIKQSNNSSLTAIEREWIEVQLQAYGASPVILIKEEPGINCFRKMLIRLVNSHLFDSFIIVCILLNTLVLAMTWYDQGNAIQQVLINVNFAFMAIFTIEAILKLIAMKLAYFKDGWNVFDFIVVVATIVALIIASIPELKVDVSQQATMIRILRILRVLRMFKRAEKLKIISETIMTALPALASLGALLFLFIFLFAVIGVQLFAFGKLHDAINYHVNFQSFFTAFLLLLRCATGEAWNELMFDTARPYSILNQCQHDQTYEHYFANNSKTEGCGNTGLAKTYFIAYQVVVGQIFLNLFIAIIVDTFIAQTAAFTLPVKKLDVDTFVTVWKKYDNNATGYIHWKHLDSFINELNKSDADFFKYNKQDLEHSYLRESWIRKMEFPLHHEMQDFYFYDVLNLICRHACESAFYLKQVQDLDDVRDQIVTLNQHAGIELSKRDLDIMANEQVQKEAKEKYDDMIFRVVELDTNIEMVYELKNLSSSVTRRSLETLSNFEHNHADDDLGYYTSSHIVSLHKIISIYQRNRANKNGVPQDKYFYKHNPPLLYELGVNFQDLAQQVTSNIRTDRVEMKKAQEDEEQKKKDIASASSSVQTGNTSTRNIIEGKISSATEGDKTLPNKNQIQPMPQVSPTEPEMGHHVKNNATVSGLLPVAEDVNAAVEE